MEELPAKSMGSDVKASFTQLPSIGDDPQSWKKYIDSVKRKVQSWDDYRRNRMLSYLYVSAFTVIPDTDTSLSHAQLLTDYAEFKSQHDLPEAGRLLEQGRRTFAHHAIVHVASAELELKKGQRVAAVDILQKALSLNVEPVSVITRALQRLDEDKTGSLDHVHTGSTAEHQQDNDTHSDILRDISNRPSCQKEVSSSKSPRPDVLTSQSAAFRQVPTSDLLLEKHHKHDSSSAVSDHSCLQPQVTEVVVSGDVGERKDTCAIVISQPTPRQGPSRKLQLPSSYTTNGLTVEMSGPVTHPSNDTWPGYYSTPLSVRSGDHKEARAESTRDLQVKQHSGLINSTFPIQDHLSVWSSAITPAKTHTVQSNCLMGDEFTPGASLDLDAKKGSTMSQCSGPESSGEVSNSQLSSTFRKFRPLNLGPPRRVKVNPALKKLRDEDEEEIHSQEEEELTSSGTDPPAQLGQSVSASICTIPEQTQEETHSGVQPDMPSQMSRMGLLTTARSDIVTPLSTAPCASRLHASSGFPVVVQSTHESAGTFPHQPRDLLKAGANGDSGQRCEITSVLKVHPVIQQGHSRKVQLPPSSTGSRLTVDMSGPVAQPSSTNVPPVYSGVPECDRVSQQPQVKAKSMQEVLEKQQVLIQQLLQQQQQQQQQKQQQQQHGGVNNRTFSVGEPQSSTVVSGVAPAVSHHSQAGHKIMVVNGKPYTVMNLVGRGGSAKVYRVYDPESNTIVALKCVNLSCANQVVVEGYKNEIILLKKLQNCGPVIKLYDYEYVEASKKLFVVLEYGETDLCKFISQNENQKKCLHPINIRYFWLQMVSAVHAMHQEGVIHSDLKPANFILVSGEVKLIDFGIANSLQQDNTSVLKENMVGTPSYMSPEALMSVSSYTDDSKPRYKIGVRSDVWSLGCILYQMVYGHTPFQHVRQKLEAIVNPAHEIPFPDKGDPDLMDVLQKCLTRNILERPTTTELLNHAYLQK